MYGLLRLGDLLSGHLKQPPGLLRVNGRGVLRQHQYIKQRQRTG